MEIEMRSDNGNTENLEYISVSVNKATSMVSVSRRFLYDEIKFGRLKSGKAGRRRIIVVADLRAWARSRVDE
jgi:hypothetical protein